MYVRVHMFLFLCLYTVSVSVFLPDSLAVYTLATHLSPSLFPYSSVIHFTSSSFLLVLFFQNVSFICKGAHFLHISRVTEKIPQRDHCNLMTLPNPPPPRAPIVQSGVAVLTLLCPPQL